MRSLLLLLFATHILTPATFFFRTSVWFGLVRLAASWSWPVNYHLNAVDVKKFDVYAERCVILNRLNKWMNGWMAKLQRAKKFDAFFELITCMMDVLHLVQHHGCYHQKHWLKNCHVWLLSFWFIANFIRHVMFWWKNGSFWTCEHF